MNAPVLPTGATGYIGGRLLRRFEDGGRWHYFRVCFPAKEIGRNNPRISRASCSRSSTRTA
jgi:hypothetical protein